MSYPGQRLAFPPLSPAIKHLMIANAVIFVLNALLLGRFSNAVDGGGFWFAFSGSGLLDGFGLGVLRIVSYQFTHSFTDVFHFLMNMLVLYFFGTMSEPRLGYRGACKLYLIGGAVGAALHLLIAAIQGHPNVPLVGASGACYAFLVYAAATSPNAEVIFIVLRVPLWLLAGVLVFVGAYSTFVEFAAGYAGGVSHGAHLGGALLGFVACKRRWFVDLGSGGHGSDLFTRLQGRWRDRRRQRAAERAALTEQQLDVILAKVKSDGIGALSPSERRFLEQASQRTREQSRNGS